MPEFAKKVFVIGLDGGTFEVIKPLIAEGQLPNFAKILKEGSHSKLLSTIPPGTPPAWSSFMTGKNPGKHGVFNFLSFPKGTYQRPLVSSRSIKSRKLWHILQDHGLKVGLMDIPLTYPPEKVNGFMISGIPFSSALSIFTYPSELHLELIRELGDYPLEDKVFYQPSEQAYLSMLKMLYLFTQKRQEAAIYLYKKYKPDFFMLVHRGTDLIQHAAFRFANPDYCKKYPDLASKFGAVIAQFYEKIDTYLGQLIDMLDADTTIFLMSDHGGGPIKGFFFINKWLIEEGFLKLKKPCWWYKRKLRIPKKTPAEIFKKLGFSQFSNLIPKLLANRKLPIPIYGKVDPMYQVDWQKTIAYSNFSGADPMLRINLKGREPQGSVSPGSEYEKVRDQLIEKLHQIKDPKTGEKIVEKVFKKEEIYHGPYLEEAHDLQIRTLDSAYDFRGSLQAPSIIFTPEHLAPATHRIYGIFAALGKNIKTGIEFDNAQIIDLAPSILYALGLPIPDDLDGRVLTEVFDQELLKHSPPKTEEAKLWEDLSGSSSETFTEAEKKDIEESLRQLGYIT